MSQEVSSDAAALAEALAAAADSSEYGDGDSMSALMNSASCAIACLEAPTGLQTGVDIKSFAVGRSFMGIRGIPPGIRMFHYRQKGSEGPSRAVFVKLGNASQLGEGALRVKALRWRPELEDFVEVDEEDNARVEAAVLRHELDANLGPYDQEHFARWQALTNYWDDQVLARVGIRFGAIVLNAIPDDVSKFSAEESLAYCAPQFTVLPDLARVSKNLRSMETDSTSRGTEFFKSSKGIWLTPAEITALQLDPSRLILRLLELSYENHFTQFMGEIQLAFICFVYLSSLQGLEFWKTAIHMVSSSTALKSTHSKSISDFCDLMANQLFLLPKDLFQNELLIDNFLCRALSSLIQIDEAPVALKPAVNGLRNALKKQYGASLLNRLDTFADDEERAFDAAALQSALPHTRPSTTTHEDMIEGISSSRLEDRDGDDEQHATDTHEDPMDTSSTPPPASESSINNIQGGRAPVKLERMAWMLP